MKPILRSLPVALLIALLAYAAFSKLAAFSLFRVQLMRQTFPQAWTGVLLYLIPGAELLAAGLLLSSRTLLQGLLLSLLLLLVFTGYISMVLIHWWDREPCPCGGILSHLSWTGHLFFNLAFIVLNLVAIKIHLKERRAPGSIP